MKPIEITDLNEKPEWTGTYGHCLSLLKHWWFNEFGEVFDLQRCSYGGITTRTSSWIRRNYKIVIRLPTKKSGDYKFTCYPLK